MVFRFECRISIDKTRFVINNMSGGTTINKKLLGVSTFKVSLALKAKLWSLDEVDDLFAASFFFRHLLVGCDLDLQMEHQRPFLFSHSDDLWPGVPQVKQVIGFPKFRRESNFMTDDWLLDDWFREFSVSSKCLNEVLNF